MGRYQIEEKERLGFPITVNFNCMEASQSVELISSQIFHNYAVAFGALVGGLGGFVVLVQYAVKYKEDFRRKRLFQELKTRYPVKLNGGTYQLINSDKRSDWIYLWDKKSNKKHHIASLSTFRNLDYDRSMVKKLTNEDFDSISEGEEFLTTGERFS